MNITRRAAFAATLAPLAAPALAQDAWPSRTVRIVVPYAPGGGTDVTTRALAEAMGSRTGHGFVVENRAGANGVVGTEAVARATPDGYTFGAQTSTHIMARQLVNLPYDPVTDFQLVSLMARYPLVMMASNRAPFQDIRGMLEQARNTPGGMAQGTSDAQSSFAARNFAKRANIELNEVPYRGSGAYLADLTAGHLPMAWGSPATARALVQSGQIRLIGVTSPERSPFLPDVPTLREAGVTGADFIGWFGLLAPARTPTEITSKFNQALNEIIATPAMRERYASLGNEFAPMNLEQLATLMREDDARWIAAAREGLITRQ
ncbi:tripartite tricarboxylate transporter substrate binding protein [Rhodovarius crocodyli]|uniref:Tripartite tricarboxylate transporter substrate binding protein n=1 Tax=Rhodovarius crocodyli TaxID=1979269 RepID=A0A437MNX4_9PROT|nr:tripartite tricarboxylate transporter substrate binding protein [Rhodovarius crocodyli]RVT99348.1 tripartite tricarboxylate transporter substrate binding protein [Rhodovarius crocodyli]